MRTATRIACVVLVPVFVGSLAGTCASPEPTAEADLGGRAFRSVWYRTPEKRGTMAAFLASGDLIVGKERITFTSKKLQVSIPTAAVTSVEVGVLRNDPVNDWMIITFNEGGATKAAAFRDAGFGGESQAIYLATMAAWTSAAPEKIGTMPTGSAAARTATVPPPSWGDVVHDTCVEVKSKSMEERDEEKRRLMAHLYCQVAASGCRDAPAEEPCKNVLEMLDNSLADSGKPMLYLTAKSGRAELCATLLGMGRDPNVTAASGWTPLMVACDEGHVEVVAVLLRAGADRSRADQSGMTALRLAQAKGRAEIVALLDRNPAESQKAPHGQ